MIKKADNNHDDNDDDDLMGEKVGCLVCSALDLPCRAEQKKENDSFG